MQNKLNEKKFIEKIISWAKTLIVSNGLQTQTMHIQSRQTTALL